jgi:UDP-N-acetylmuramoylalanine--D-glutamate ligase
LLPGAKQGAVASDRSLDAARVLIVGAARSGLAAAAALRRARPGTRVRLIDRDALPDELPSGVEGVLGDDPELAEDCDIVVKSPGVPASSPVVVAARAAGLPIWSEVELAFRLLGPEHPWIGITGTNGKSTTTSLTGAMLRAGGVPCAVAGNIGDAVSGLVGELDPGSWVVCELSSFQLEDVDELHPRVAVLLNVTPDHLDRHGSFDAYAEAKLRVFTRQRPDDVAVLDDDDPWISRLPDAAVPGSGQRVRIRVADAPEDLLEAFAGSRLAGSHNLENVLCAAAAAGAAGADRHGVLEAVRAFRPLAHRMEQVGELGGVRFINDSKATNQEAAIRALGAFTHGVHLILGGSLKGGDFAPLAQAVAHGPVSATYLIGAAADAIEHALVVEHVSARRYDSLAEAVAAAARAAGAGDTVLLAPACASFDQFRDFEDRGDQFRALVEELAA